MASATTIVRWSYPTTTTNRQTQSRHCRSFSISFLTRLNIPTWFVVTFSRRCISPPPSLSIIHKLLNSFRISFIVFHYTIHNALNTTHPRYFCWFRILVFKIIDLFSDALIHNFIGFTTIPHSWFFLFITHDTFLNHTTIAIVVNMTATNIGNVIILISFSIS